MTPQRAVHIVGEVGKALDYAHRRQLLASRTDEAITTQPSSGSGTTAARSARQSK